MRQCHSGSPSTEKPYTRRLRQPATHIPSASALSLAASARNRSRSTVRQLGQLFWSAEPPSLGVATPIRTGCEDLVVAIEHECVPIGNPF
jgi:hypothetical protein